MKTYFSFAIIALLTGLMMTSSPARDFKLRDPNVLAAEAQIAAGKSQTWRFAATPPKAGQRTLLRCWLRMNHENYAGCNYTLKVLVNGQELKPGTREAPRLLSHPNTIHLSEYNDQATSKFENYWLVMYAPDFASKQVREGDDSLFVFDVTDLLKTQGENELVIEHQGAQLSAATKIPIPFVIKDLAVGTVPEAEARETTELEKALAFTPGISARTAAYEVTVPPGGGMQIKVGKNAELYFVDSRFSFPNAGWNVLSPTATLEGEAAWKPRVAGSTRALEVNAESSQFKLKRSIALEPHRVVVSDTFTNKTTQIIGLRLTNQIHAASAKNVWVAGSTQFDEISGALDNPTVFAQFPNAGIGLLAEDDVYRVQSNVYYDRRFAGVGSNEFGLPANGAYTLRWAIYPTASGDAFDFINQVRRDWGVNDNTIDGPGMWLDVDAVKNWSDEKLKDELRLHSAKIVLLKPWLITFDIPHIGSYEKYKPIFKEVIARIHRLRPGTKVLGMIHPTMTFAKTGESYDSAAYRDSFVQNADGSHLWSDLYTKAWFGDDELKANWKNYCNFAVPGNSYYPRLMQWIDRARNELGADGVYSDELNHFTSVASISYGAWDGHTIKVDPDTFVADTKLLMSRLAYTTEKTQNAIVTRSQENGGFFLSNTQPGLGSLQKRKYLTFTEIPDPKLCARSYLYTPIGLGWTPAFGSRKWENDADVFQNIREHVENGALYYFYETPQLKRETVAGKMYPFTPLDIRSGVLQAHERIITTKSGRYNWDKPCQAKVWSYDAQGVLLDAAPRLQNVTPQMKLEVAVPIDGMAVIEKVGKA